jgi:sRNA-binding carbon storage regulator CsrA
MRQSNKSPFLPRSNTMKVFLQAKNESVVINDEIIVTVLDVIDDEVIMEIDAPEWFSVCEKQPLQRSESACQNL